MDASHPISEDCKTSMAKVPFLFLAVLGKQELVRMEEWRCNNLSYIYEYDVLN